MILGDRKSDNSHVFGDSIYFTKSVLVKKFRRFLVDKMEIS